MSSETPVFSYLASGLLLQSDIELPGLIPLADDRDADVIVRLGTVPPQLDDATTSGPTWQIKGQQFLLRVPGVARFLLEDGRRIVIDPENGTPPHEIAIFVIGTVLGILLHQRQQIVLHASAVRVNGKAVLFCGPSGAGKSTMAATLIGRGFDLVTDDLCAISITNGVPRVHPDGRLLKLWADTINKLDLTDQRGEAVRTQLEKFYVDPVAACADPLPLGAIYMLREARPPHVAGIERPNVVDATAGLRRNAYRPMLVKRMEQRAAYFHAVTAIANHVGIFYLTRPLNFVAIPDTLASLEQHWAEIGLTDRSA